MPKHDDTWYINNYFRNRLSKKERLSFDERRKSDPDFAQKVKQYQKDLAATHSAEHDALRQQASVANQKSNNNRRWDRILAVAGVVWVLISAVNWWISNTPATTDALYATYYETPKPSAPGKVAKMTLMTWSFAVASYSDQNYSMALKYFTELLNTEQFVAQSEVQFYAGICQLELEHYKGAIISLMSVSPKSTYSLDAKWYLSLAYLKTNQVEIAKSLLSDFSNASGYKAPEAEMIILKIQDQ